MKRMGQKLDRLCFHYWACMAFQMGQSDWMCDRQYVCIHFAPFTFVVHKVAPSSRVHGALISVWWLEGSMSTAL